MNKKTILLVNEASFLSTGYSTYGRELFKRLFNTGKYNLYELATYGHSFDERVRDIPWGFYGNLPAAPMEVPGIDKAKEEAEYNSSPINVFCKWRFDEVLLDCKPDIVCIPPGELVMTKEGYRPIENLKVGDYVLTHKGRFKKVVKTFKRQYIGKMAHVFFNGCKKPLILTDNHPILVYKKRKQTNKKKSYKKIYDKISPEFLTSKQINKGDLIVLPYPQKQIDNIIINISDYLTQYVEKNSKLEPTTHGSQIPKYIKLDSSLARLIGYLLGDGCIHENGISITFNVTEQRFVEDAVNLIYNIFGILPTINHPSSAEDKQCSIIHANSILLSEFLSKWMGKNTSKRIPKDIWTATKEVREGLICGLVRSNGCYKFNTVSYASVSKRLANEFRMLCLSVDIPTNLQFSLLHGKNGSYNIEGYGESAYKLHNIAKKHPLIDIPVDIKKSCRGTQIINNTLVSSIRMVRYHDYQGQVYNIEVEEDNSYIVQQSCVHNCSIRDPWMDSFISDSVFRGKFKRIWMPTVDSVPQQNDWIADMIDCDGISTYTEWAQEYLKNAGGGKINLIGVHGGGCDGNVYKPMFNKKELRQKYGVPENAFVVGTVMRNQKRKLYSDLIQAFEIFLSKANPDLAKRAILYLHVSHPDMGWDITNLIKQSSASNKILVTYRCLKCQHVYASLFRDIRTHCPNCKSPDSGPPNSKQGVSVERLAEIYNLFDVYIQYAICEGLGIPGVEAASCGIPVVGVDYSGMEDYKKRLGATNVKVERFFLEAETQAYRAWPDNIDLAEKLLKLANLPTQVRMKKGFEARQKALKYYDWSVISKNWEDVFDNFPVFDKQAKWSEPPNIFNPAREPLKGLSNENFVQWLFTNVLGKPEEIYSYKATRMVKDLNYGAHIQGRGGMYLNDHSLMSLNPQWREYHQNEAFQDMLNERLNINHWEQIRCGLVKRETPWYIRAKKMPNEAISNNTNN